ncbi:uncharacterized protein LOC144113920 [Amblyomma americanum]
MSKLELCSQSKSPRELFTQLVLQQDAMLNKEDFSSFLSSLFTDFDEVPTAEKQTAIKFLFETFDSNHDGGIDISEFETMWTQWAQAILCPKWALIVVDVQNDFITGTLSVKNLAEKQDPEGIVPVINDLAENLPWELVVYSQDWHPPDHISFFENKDHRHFHASSKVSTGHAKVFDTVVFVDDKSSSGSIEQTLWPAHCIQGTWGAELHKDLRVPSSALKIRKGISPDVDSYSAFWDNDKRSSTVLDNELKARKITGVVICGIAYDVCVASTASHAMCLGYQTVIVDNASCGTCAAATEATKSCLAAKHCVFLESSEVKQLISGGARPLQLGLQLAKATSAKNI